jgi:SAM-dependent methyltransferase
MKSYLNQFALQHRLAFGRILNVGADIDSSNFRARKAVNVDAWKHNPFTQQDLPVDVVADCRALPADLHGRFDSAILGDILEHFVERSDVLLALGQAKRCLAPGGRVIITCPEDHRTPAEAGLSEPYPMYGPGIRAYHAYPVTLGVIRGWCTEAGLKIIHEAYIAYEFLPQSGGWGVAAVPNE